MPTPASHTLAGGLLTCPEHHHGFTAHAGHAARFQRFQHPPNHFPRTAHDAAYFLARDFDLHAIRVRHGVGLAAQVMQSVSNPPRNIQKRQIIHFGREMPHTF